MPPVDHVALNACFLDPGVSGGPESYLVGLAPALAAARPAARMSVLTTRRGAASLTAAGWTDWATVVAMPCDEGERVRRISAEVLGIPAWVKRHRPTVLHNLASIGPPRRVAAAQVVTLHDLTFLRLATFGQATTAAMRWLSLGTARHSDRIITATEASLDEIVELGGVDRADVDVVPHGRRPIEPVSAETVERVRAEHELVGRRVVLNVAAKRPHKNQAVIVRAMAQLTADAVLVLAGHAEPYADELRSIAAELGVEGRVRFLDYVTDAELEALWTIADAAAFPTRGEGFGLPVIEAMDRGLPVACSRIPVLLEVSGGLAHTFDPDDPAEAAAAIDAALVDPTAGEAGRAHAQQFTWANAAEQT
ncbi:MAG: glycosyltransferase family 1 protein, partial [Solirubrobacteraceae bacterium]